MTEPATAAPLAVGLVGHGRWGTKIARSLPDAGGRLAAVAVGGDAGAAALRERRAAPVITNSPAELLADRSVEAVIVATPAPTHEALAREVLAAGKDLFVEKPLCLSAGSALELREEARERGLVLMTGHVFLYHPAVARLRRLVVEGALGEVESVAASWLNTKPQPGDLSVLWNLGPHPLSLIAWLLGTSRVTVEAAGNQDRVEIAIACDRGWDATAVVAWNSPVRERSLTVRGSAGVAHFDGESGELSLGTGDGPPGPIACGREPALTAELCAFVEAVRSRQTPAQEGVTATVTSWLEKAAG